MVRNTGDQCDHADQCDQLGAKEIGPVSLYFDPCDQSICYVQAEYQTYIFQYKSLLKKILKLT